MFNNFLAISADNLSGGTLAGVIVIILLFFIVISNIKIVTQTNSFIVERLGSYRDTWKTGVHFKIPFIEKVAKGISLKEQVGDYPPQPVITKDNVRMQIDTVVYYQVTDPKLYAYGIDNPLYAIELLTATSLRNIIGDLELDQTLTSRDHINTRMRALLDEATDPWGIKVNRVELKNILPPREIQDAMEKQMKAERERRELILRAEGEKSSSILVAEGKKQAVILEAEAQNEATVLRANAKKQAMILEATGEAEAIRQVQIATADGIKFINESTPSREAIAIKSLEAFARAADGKATKIIIPSDIQGIAGLATSIKEIMKNDDALNSDIKK